MPLDGWGPLLDRDGYMSGGGEQQLKKSPFTCPEARDVDGLLAGQTGNNPDNPRGWMDWPCIRTGAGFTPTQPSVAAGPASGGRQPAEEAQPPLALSSSGGPESVASPASGPGTR